MPRYRLLAEYDGAPFAGWQVQPGQTTVQGTLEEALTIALREPTRVTGSGRTDAGVHALGQVAHFEAPGDTDPFRLHRALNGILRYRAGGAIAILAIEEAPHHFHARYNAHRRLYWYRVSTHPRALDREHRWFLRPEPNWDRMNEAAKHLLGTHHFGAFCLAQSETENRVCTVERARWVEEERSGDWRFEIAADRFLHGMVRAAVGTLVEVGHGKRAPDSLPATLATEDRRAAGPAAPPHGLALTHVAYPDGFGEAFAPRGVVEPS